MPGRERAARRLGAREVSFALAAVADAGREAHVHRTVVRAAASGALASSPFEPVARPGQAPGASP